MVLKIKTLLISILIVGNLVCYAQKPPKKFGDIDFHTVKAKIHPLDSNAEAVVLFDFGLTRFQYINSEGFRLVFERQKRVKIIRSDGYKYATVEIPIYRSNGGKEEVNSLKAYTYNINNGKVQKIKFDKKDIIEEEVSKNWTKVKFTLPNVVEGSVIEYSYELTSDFIFNLQSWTFQDFIPTVYSEYNVRIPEYFYYQKLSKGYHPLEINRSTSSSSITLVSEAKSNVYQAGNTLQSDNIGYTLNDEQWIARNVSAISKEPFMSAPSNYITKIGFELERTQFPQQAAKTYMESWPELNEKFLENEYFGRQIEGSSFLKRELEKLDLSSEDVTKKIASVYTHVQSKMSWNGFYRKYVEFNLKKPYDAGKGSVSEVNLTLISMLNKSGMRAEPVLLSTRSHGLVNQYFAKADQFNYVICKAYLPDDKFILLDATSKSLPMGQLPRRCLNGSGWVVSKTNSGWININKYIGKTSKSMNANLELNEEGLLGGHITFSYGGYEAESQRSEYFKNSDEYNQRFTNNSSFEVATPTVKNDKNLNDPFKVEIDLEGIDEDAETIYFQPFLFDDLYENPFKSETRNFPIDFSYPFEKKYVVSLELGDSYEVVEVPKPKVIALPNNAGKFVYQASLIGNKINIVSVFSINKSLFIPDEYPYLRAFYDQAIAKKQELIVIKKK